MRRAKFVVSFTGQNPDGASHDSYLFFERDVNNTSHSYHSENRIEIQQHRRVYRKSKRSSCISLFRRKDSLKGNIKIDGGQNGEENENTACCDRVN